MPSGGRNIASVSFAPIDDISPKAGVHADPNFSFQGFSGWQERRQEKAQPLRNVSGNFDTASSTFVMLLNQEQMSQDVSKPGAATKGAFQGLLSKAIRAYEGTASVIHGKASPRGSSYSAMF
jgi:hypothetical protein